jgi:hypothetical protein
MNPESLVHYEQCAGMAALGEWPRQSPPAQINQQAEYLLYRCPNNTILRHGVGYTKHAMTTAVITGANKELGLGVARALGDRCGRIRHGVAPRGAASATSDPIGEGLSARGFRADLIEMPMLDMTGSMQAALAME